MSPNRRELLVLDREGWALASGHAAAKTHYFRNGRSLCGEWTEAIHAPTHLLDADFEGTCKHCLDRLDRSSW